MRVKFIAVFLGLFLVACGLFYPEQNSEPFGASFRADFSKEDYEKFPTTVVLAKVLKIENSTTYHGNLLYAYIFSTDSGDFRFELEKMELDLVKGDAVQLSGKVMKGMSEYLNDLVIRKNDELIFAGSYSSSGFSIPEFMFERGEITGKEDGGCPDTIYLLDMVLTASDGAVDRIPHAHSLSIGNYIVINNITHEVPSHVTPCADSGTQGMSAFIYRQKT